MKIKASAVVMILASTMFAAVGPIQASCYKNQPGWHMVSKKCNIKPADNWQEYNSGVYIQPMVKDLF
jgi:hypothetical protein